MVTGRELYQLLARHVGEKYVLGAIVPKNYKDYSGPWDCAEFASWGVYQLTAKLYGCANNTGDPSGADAYSGFWVRDARKIGKIITVGMAAQTPGAVVVRVSGRDILGHVAISNGHGATVEAHSTKSGVITSSLSHRRWDFGILVPWITYEVMDPVPPPVKKPYKVYRWTSPMMFGDKVKEIQKAVGMTNVDGYFGPKTFNAVRGFQRNVNLVADGEVGPQTAASLNIIL